jgi:hypothetical protein
VAGQACREKRCLGIAMGDVDIVAECLLAALEWDSDGDGQACELDGLGVYVAVAVLVAVRAEASPLAVGEGAVESAGSVGSEAVEETCRRKPCAIRASLGPILACPG